MNHVMDCVHFLTWLSCHKRHQMIYFGMPLNLRGSPLGILQLTSSTWALHLRAMKVAMWGAKNLSKSPSSLENSISFLNKTSIFLKLKVGFFFSVVFSVRDVGFCRARVRRSASNRTVIRLEWRNKKNKERHCIDGVIGHLRRNQAIRSFWKFLEMLPLRFHNIHVIRLHFLSQRISCFWNPK